MKFCPNCGTQIENGNMNCNECGANFFLWVPENGESISEPKHNIAALDDKAAYNGIFWFVILGMLFPLIGVILYLIWKNTNPVKARAVGIVGLFPISIISFYFVYLP